MSETLPGAYCSHLSGDGAIQLDSDQGFSWNKQTSRPNRKGSADSMDPREGRSVACSSHKLRSSVGHWGLFVSIAVASRFWKKYTSATVLHLSARGSEEMNVSSHVAFYTASVRS